MPSFRQLELIPVDRSREHARALRHAGLTVAQIHRLYIHETAKVAAALDFWAGVLRVSPERMSKPILKRHRPKTNRKNVGSNYHGCLVVTVRRSADLYRRIDGTWQGVALAATGHAQVTDDTMG